MEYEDFSIWIAPAADGTYQVRIDSPAGKGKATLELPFEAGQVGGLLTGLARSVRGAAPAADSNGGSDSELRDIATGVPDPPTAADAAVPSSGAAEVGTRLYQALFQGEVQQLYDRSLARTQMSKDHGLRIRLNLDLEDEGLRELSRLPWEFLNSHAGGNDLGFLNLSEDTPLVRDLDVSQPPDPLPFEPPLRVLVVIANPPGSTPLNLQEERETIEETFATLEGVEIDVLQQATPEELNDRLDLEDYHVLHYMGHGDFDEQSGGVLLLEGKDDEPAHVSGTTLALMLRNQADTARLVFLNACKTAMSSREGALDPFGGVATSLIEVGIPAVVAMQFPISDAAAIHFSRTFYHRIVHGKPVDAAVAAARLSLRVDQPTTKEWATPVLFMRCKDGVLFDMGAPPSTPDPIVDVEEATDEPVQNVPMATEPPRSVAPAEPAAPAEPVVPAGVDQDADYAVWLAEQEGNVALNWRARAPASRDFVALFRGQPTDPDRYLSDEYEYASREGSYRTGVPASPGYWVAYIAEDASGEKTIMASWGPTT